MVTPVGALMNGTAVADEPASETLEHRSGIARVFGSAVFDDANVAASGYEIVDGDVGVAKRIGTQLVDGNGWNWCWRLGGRTGHDHTWRGSGSDRRRNI